MNSFVKILSGICGILLLGAGIGCLFYPALYAAKMLPILMVIVMFSIAFTCFGTYSVVKESRSGGLVLSEGIIALILGIILIFVPLATDALIFIFFASWITTSGVLRIAKSLELKKENDSSWSLAMISGVLAIIAGIICFVNPQITAFTLGIIISIVLIVQGFNYIMMAFAKTNA